jgi:hypothetical protein
MKKKLVSTQNSLDDVVNWLKDGFNVCVYSSYGLINTGLYFYSRETLEELKMLAL